MINWGCWWWAWVVGRRIGGCGLVDVVTTFVVAFRIVDVASWGEAGGGGCCCCCCWWTTTGPLDVVMILLILLLLLVTDDDLLFELLMILLVGVDPPPPALVPMPVAGLGRICCGPLLFTWCSGGGCWANWGPASGAWNVAGMVVGCLCCCWRW